MKIIGYLSVSMKTIAALAFGVGSVIGGERPLRQAQCRPNILFIIADDASFEHFGANGCTWVNTIDSPFWALDLDIPKRMTITNNDEANALLQTEARESFRVEDLSV